MLFMPQGKTDSRLGIFSRQSTLLRSETTIANGQGFLEAREFQRFAVINSPWAWTQCPACDIPEFRRRFLVCMP